MGLSALRELYLSHNLLQSIQGDNLLGLAGLQVLSLDHNQLSSLPPDLFTRLAKLRVLSLHHNHLTSLEPAPGTGPAVLQRVSLQHNRWACSHHTDCHWVTLTLETFSKSAIADISQVSSESNQASSILKLLFRSTARKRTRSHQRDYKLLCLPAQTWMSNLSRPGLRFRPLW